MQTVNQSFINIFVTRNPSAPPEPGGYFLVSDEPGAGTLLNSDAPSAGIILTNDA